VAALRLLLTITSAAWIWLELVAVLGPTLLDHLRGRGRGEDAGSAAVLLLGAGVAFWAATRLARLSAGALPAPPPALLAGGLALMWTGLALRVWAIRHLAGTLRAFVVGDFHRGLVTSGPYRHLRHPSYAGALLTAAGFGVALGHWTSLLVLIVGWAAGLAYRIRVEEAVLRGAFGPAYEEYAARTRRLIPLLY
jgi:protein-S-isoprenylcysteine O-methyltransferase Ste14